MDSSHRASETERVPTRPGQPQEGDAVARLVREYGTETRRRERDRALARLDDPTATQRAAVDDLATSLVAAILEAPIEHLEGSECAPATARVARSVLVPNEPGVDD